MKSKKIAKIVIIIILLILLIPIPFKLKDGGTVEWKSLTYSISKVNSIYSIDDIRMGYKKGIVIKIFNITVFNNSKYDIEKEFVIVDSSKNNENFACDSALEEIYKDDDIFFLGRGIDYAIALEGSLKLKEISYIHSEAYAAGELKHGTISLIDKDTPVIAIITDNSIKDKTISNVKEVKVRGAKTILVANENLDNNCFDKKVIIPSTHPLLQPLLTVIPLQLIAYEVAKLRECDIDKPKNLAKSVTVE